MFNLTLFQKRRGAIGRGVVNHENMIGRAILRDQ